MRVEPAFRIYTGLSGVGEGIVPELPEVDTICRGLQKLLVNATVKSLKVLRTDSVAYPEVADFVRLLRGRTFCSVGRRGKYLLFQLSENTGLAAHLRMSGRFLVSPAGQAEPDHVRVRFDLSDGRRLFFADTRVFGRLWFVPEGRSFEDIVPALRELGPEPLSGLKPQHLQACFAGKSRSVKAALLDQTIVAGIGNIYADESLYRARINPDRAAGDLSLAELKRLCKEIVCVLSNAIELRGSSLQNYTDANGVNGNYQLYSLVYGRAGEPCRRCKSKIERIKLSGRATHFCPRCQPE